MTGLSAVAALHLSLAVIALGQAMTSSEMLWLISKGAFRDGGIWPWPLLKHNIGLGVRRAVDPFLRESRLPYIAAARLLTSGAVIVCLSAGISPLIPTLLLIVIQMLVQLRSGYGTEGADQMTMIVLVACAVGEAGRGQPAVPAFSALFIGCQIGLSYVASGTAKLFGPKWRNGSALPSIMNHYAYGHPWLSRFLSDYRGIARLMGLGIIAFQVSFWIFFLLPSPLAWLYVIGGICFHLAIAVFMRLYQFMIVFVGTYPCLLFAHDLVGSCLLFS